RRGGAARPYRGGDVRLGSGAAVAAALSLAASDRHVWEGFGRELPVSFAISGGRGRAAHAWRLRSCRRVVVRVRLVVAVF
ncbi:MAG: hypothetical protein M3379_10060, partial [Acidobacteriota bacterium]|nr:hypothetical protein [Acidobacteriota bacterium]